MYCCICLYIIVYIFVYSLYIILVYFCISLYIFVYLCILLYIFVYSCISIGASPVAVSESKEETLSTDRGSGHLDIQRLLSQLKSGHRKPPLPLHFDGPKPTASPREGN